MEPIGKTLSSVKPLKNALSLWCSDGTKYMIKAECEDDIFEFYNIIYHDCNARIEPDNLTSDIIGNYKINEKIIGMEAISRKINGNNITGFRIELENGCVEEIFALAIDEIGSEICWPEANCGIGICKIINASNIYLPIK